MKFPVSFKSRGVNEKSIANDNAVYCAVDDEGVVSKSGAFGLCFEPSFILTFFDFGQYSER